MLYYLMTTLYVFVCLMLLLVILLQQGKGGDISNAFGGGSSQAAFGARTGATLLSKLTTVFAVPAGSMEGIGRAVWNPSVPTKWGRGGSGGLAAARTGAVGWLRGPAGARHRRRGAEVAGQGAGGETGGCERAAAGTR